MADQIEEVILVDEFDNPIGTMEKLEAHLAGKLHRAISVFIFNSQGELLLQQRAAGKYHSAGLWSNTCCSHPRPGETNIAAAQRRLTEEMGLDCTLYYRYGFIYKAELDAGLTEHEYDHVFFGISDQHPELNPLEASDFQYASMGTIAADIERNPSSYSAWFKLCVAHINSQQAKGDGLFD